MLRGLPSSLSSINLSVYKILDMFISNVQVSFVEPILWDELGLWISSQVFLSNFAPKVDEKYKKICAWEFPTEVSVPTKVEHDEEEEK